MLPLFWGIILASHHRTDCASAFSFVFDLEVAKDGHHIILSILEGSLDDFYQDFGDLGCLAPGIAIFFGLPQ